MTKKINVKKQKQIIKPKYSTSMKRSIHSSFQDIKDKMFTPLFNFPAMSAMLVDKWGHQTYFDTTCRYPNDLCQSKIFNLAQWFQRRF